MTDFFLAKGICRFILLVFIYANSPLTVTAQVNKYIGTWSMSYRPDANGSTVHMELKIGIPEKEIIYPASIIIKCDSFYATYDFFLVKKTYNQLGISIYKKPVSETPFSVGVYTRYINNVFQYNKDVKKGISISLLRLSSKAFIDRDDIEVDEKYKSTATLLKRFFLSADINLKKVDTSENPTAVKNTNVFYRGTEFGLMDTLHVGTDTIGISIPVNKKNDTDTVNVAFNGGTIVLEADIRKKTSIPFLELSKGENIVVLFAENYGSAAGNNGKLLLDGRTVNVNLDLSLNDPFATFAVARLFYYPQKDTTEKAYETNTFIPASMTVRPTRTTYDKISTDKILDRNTTVMGEMETKSAQITLALWDDALEDGDTISLNVNGKWLAQGFSVKKATQFINVMLERGPNKITFIAENLGSVPPNTSVLEIIDGKKRRSFKIETTLTSNNAINIFYDFKP